MKVDNHPVSVWRDVVAIQCGFRASTTAPWLYLGVCVFGEDVGAISEGLEPQPLRHDIF